MLNLALAAAASTGASACISGLLERGAEFKHPSGLMLAAKHGHFDLLRQLHELPDATNNNLFACVAAGLTDCAENLIVNHDWEPNAYSSSTNSTLLSLACKNGDFEMAHMLLKHGADPQTSWSLFSKASHNPWLSLLTGFLPRGNNNYSEFAGTPIGTLSDRAKIVQLLVSHGSRPSVVAVAEAAGMLCAGDGCTDLFDAYCLAFGDVKEAATAALPFASGVAAVRRLLLAGATVGAKELFAACKQPGTSNSYVRGDVIAALVSSPGACSVNTRDSQGRTVLSWAALGVNASVVTALLGLGADPALVDAAGHTALDLVLAALTGTDGGESKAIHKSSYHWIFPFGGSERWNERLNKVVGVLQQALPIPDSSSPSKPSYCGMKRRASYELEMPRR